jgi:phosphoglucomutase
LQSDIFIFAEGGVVCTASHNPEEYNGYKARQMMWRQMVSPHKKM